MKINIKRFLAQLNGTRRVWIAHKSRCIDWFINGIPSNFVWRNKLSSSNPVPFICRHRQYHKYIFNSGLQSPAHTFDKFFFCLFFIIADRAILIQICRFQFVAHKNGIAIKCQWLFMKFIFLFFFFSLQKSKQLKRANGCELPAFHNTPRCTKVSASADETEVEANVNVWVIGKWRGNCACVVNLILEIHSNMSQQQSIANAKPEPIHVSNIAIPGNQANKFFSSELCWKMFAMSNIWSFNFSRLFMCLWRTYFVCVGWCLRKNKDSLSID